MVHPSRAVVATLVLLSSTANAFLVVPKNPSLLQKSAASAAVWPSTRIAPRRGNKRPLRLNVDLGMSSTTANSATGAGSSESDNFLYGGSANSMNSATPAINSHASGTAEAATSTSLASTAEATADYAYYVPDLLQQQEEELLEFDLSESIVGKKGWSLDHPSLNFARVLVLGASAVYGTNFAMVKLLDEQMPLAVSAALRFSLAAVVMTSIILNGEDKALATKEDKAERGPATLAGMEIGAWYCAGYLCQALGLQTADASKSAFFNALAVIVVPLLDSAFRGKQMSAKGISSIVLAILGVALLQLGPAIQAGNDIASITRGDWFCLGQALLFGIGYWRLEHKSSTFPHQAGRVTVGLLGGVALGSTLYAGLTVDNLPSLHQFQEWFSDPFTLGALGWTALVSTALALYLETVALKAMSATELTILMTSVSLFGSGFAYLTMGETMSPIGMVGGLMILAGCVFSSLGGAATGTGTTATPPALSTMTMEEVGGGVEDWETNTLVEEEMTYSTPVSEL